MQILYYIFQLRMNSFLDQEDNSPMLLNRSCKEKIENDSINEGSSGSFQVRLTKSQKQIDQIDTQSLMEDVKKNWKGQEQSHPNHFQPQQEPTRIPIPITRNKEKRKGADFGAEIVDSESVSIDQDFISKLQGHQKVQQIQKQNSNSHKNQEGKAKNIGMQANKLNILLLGKSGIGKTSFIDSFCNKKSDIFPKYRQKTQAMKIYQYYLNQGNTEQISLIDYPGFQQINIQQYIKNIDKLIKDSFEKRYNFFKTQKNGNKNKIAADQRIHCCLFFISGPWINQCEWIIMKRLEARVNIIPLIAKGDTFTTSELKHFKKKIMEKNRIQNLNFFPIEQILRQNHPQRLQRLLNGTFGKAPPFVITCGTQNTYNEETKTYEKVRQYRWGKCKLDSDEHNDFKFLKKLLTEYLGDVLVNFTESIEKRFVEEKNREREEYFLQSSNSDILPININRSQKSDGSKSSDMGKVDQKSYQSLFLQISLTILGVATFFYIRSRNK